MEAIHLESFTTLSKLIRPVYRVSEIRLDKNVNKESLVAIGEDGREFRSSDVLELSIYP